jgi:hypothetical protein
MKTIAAVAILAVYAQAGPLVSRIVGRNSKSLREFVSGFFA